MNTVEQKLQRAAEETRQVARARWPKPLEKGSRQQTRGLLAFVAAFALVVVTFGLVPLLAGIGDTPPAADSTPPSVEPAVTSTTWPVTTTITEPEATCPDVPLPGPIEALPVAVAETRDAIIAAAASCDFGALENLAGVPFTTSYGSGGSENLALWHDQGLEPTRTLLTLLAMRHTAVQGQNGDIYVWPAAHGYESWDQVTEEDLDELARIHTEGELDLFAQSGSYMGWRTGIDEDGNWLFFVAGD